MKVNAPEKIYVYIPDDDIVGTASTQKGFPHQFVTEEYIRTDAFIEKACKFLFDNYHGEKLSLKMIEDFKQYMEGE